MTEQASRVRESDMEAAAPLIGHNEAPDYATRITEQMASEYAELSRNVADKLADARDQIPAVVETDTDLALVTKTVNDMRDIMGRCEAFRVREKEPHLRGGNAVDQFFSGLKDRLKKAMDIVGARGHSYNQRKLEAERAERDRIAREARERADADRQRALEEAEKAAELERAAARARKAENVEKLSNAAEKAAGVAELLKVEALVSSDEAERAALAALAKSADMARMRHDNGAMSTMKQVPHVEITDADALDKETLWAYISEAEKLRALKAWAKLTGHKKAMSGAIIEMRDATVYR